MLSRNIGLSSLRIAIDQLIACVDAAARRHPI
jgi:hypothetical protein